MQTQKFQLKMTSPDGKKKANAIINGNLRMMPGGFYDYAFPKEYLDVILTTMRQNISSHRYGNRYGISPFKISVLRKLLKCSPIPKEFKTDKKIFWTTNDVVFIVVGIREDEEIADPFPEYKGWTHEAV
ncbi:MAG: hypothetical protein WC711_04190 [Candidatus Staskawiczbacteria bacterium]